MSITEDLNLCLNGFRKVLEPAIEAGCSRHHRAASKIHEDQLADICVRIRELEDLTVPAVARIGNGKTGAPVLAFPRRSRTVPRPSGGGDAA